MRLGVGVVTRGDPVKSLGIAALPVLAYFHVGSAPVLANPARYRGLTAGACWDVGAMSCVG